MQYEIELINNIIVQATLDGSDFGHVGNTNAYDLYNAIQNWLRFHKLENKVEKKMIQLSDCQVIAWQIII